jgi:hypothetical protein
LRKSLYSSSDSLSRSASNWGVHSNFTYGRVSSSCPCSWLPRSHQCCRRP